MDGIEIVASLVLLATRRAGRRSGWLPWAALVIGTAGSLAANVATAGPGTISRIIAGWPALALLIAVKLLSGMLDPTSPQEAVPPNPARDHNADDPPLTAVPIPSRSPGTVRAPTAMVPPGPPGGPAGRGTEPGTDIESGTVPNPPGITDLLLAAHAARDRLHRDGHRLTRDALAAQLRENGYPVRNSRLTPLLQALRREPATMPPASADTAA